MRCYEAYCYFKNKLDDECKSERTMQRINQYVKFMESKGVEFSKTKTDKMRFLKLQDKFGSEKAVTQPSLVTLLVECAECGMGTREPTEIKGLNYCPSCAENMKGKAPSPLQRIEKKEYKPPLTWEDRKQVMHPKVSKMEQDVAVVLTKKGIPFEQQREFCVRRTIPDFYFPQANLVVYLDGKKVHKNKVEKDNFLRSQLGRLHHLKVLSITYEGRTKQNLNDIIIKILGAVEGVSDVAGRGKTVER